MMTLVAFALILIPVIVIHEFGHFIVAKLSGIFVKTFSVGFGPKLLKLRFGETQYAVSAIPFGGYVKMAGDTPLEEGDENVTTRETGETGSDSAPSRVGEGMLYPNDEVPDSEIPAHRYFRNKPLLTRLAVVTAGPVANYILAILVMTGVLWNQGFRDYPTTTIKDVAAGGDEAAAGFRSGDVITAVAGKPVETLGAVAEALGHQGEASFEVQVRRGDQNLTLSVPGVRFQDGRQVFPSFQYRIDSRVGQVKRDGPAARAGLQAGDRIVEIDGKPVASHEEIAEIVNVAIGRELTIVWERDGQRMSSVVVPEGEDALVPGTTAQVQRIGRIQIEPYQVQIPISFATAARAGFLQSWLFMRETVRFLGVLISGKASRDAIGGPIRIGQEAGSALRWGAATLFYFMAFLSVNLCLLNLLPIPVLDGGHVLFLAIEAVRGEALSTRTQEWMLRIGVSALLLLMGFVVVNDLIRLVTG